MKRILVVDDSKTNLAIFKENFSDDYDVIPVTSAQMALDFLSSNTCDLILLDIAMPDMDGFELIRIIKKNDTAKEIPVIFLTGLTDPKVETEGLELGADDFITRPFDPKVTKCRIQHIIELYELRHRLQSELHATEEKLESINLAASGTTEPLTGLYNRSYLEQAATKYLAEHRQGVFFMMDMDDFKRINDTKGHIVGDHVLRVFADMLRNAFREEDILCRMGGDEFAAFLTGKPDRNIIKSKMANFIAEVRANPDFKAVGCNMAVSVGIAMAPEDGDSFAELYSCADKALYHVKENGKNMYHFYCGDAEETETKSTEMDMLNIRRMLEGELETDNGALSVQYEEFRQIYNYICRYVNRNENQVQIILFTLHPVKSRVIETELLAQAMQCLNDSVVESLRKVDVGTQYSGSQYIVILTDSNSTDGDLVAKRVVNRFYSVIDSRLLSLEYDMQTLIPKNRHFMY